jgi:hypothetical protein
MHSTVWMLLSAMILAASAIVAGVFVAMVPHL